MEMPVDRSTASSAARNALGARREPPRVVTRRPSSMTARRLTLRWKQLFWGRVLTLFVLMFATPGPAEVFQEVISIAVSDDCCDDECGDGDGQNCAGTCAHCMCCVHSVVLPTPEYVQPAGHGTYELTFSWYGGRAYAAGYRAPPFRPPTV